MFEKREIYQAIGGLAYVMAKAGDGLKPEEKKAFIEVVRNELNFDAWVPESRFEIMDEKVHLTPALKEKTLHVITKVTEACGKTVLKTFIIDRLEKDLKAL